jgi:transposase-like protein
LAVRLVFQELIESELSLAIGAGLYERTESRTNERNGHRPRVASTKADDVSLGIPKLRKGSFFPSILEPRRRIDQALYAVVMEAYVHGISTRAVDEEDRGEDRPRIRDRRTDGPVPLQRQRRVGPGRKGKGR